MPEDLFRWGAMTSLTPVAAFLLSVPVAFVSSGLAVLCWVAVIPISILANRWAPPEAEEYFS
jgi:hypothetical protein